MRKRVLIIDDDPDVLAAVKERLHVHNFQCSTLASPEKVLKRALHWRPDLILLDLGLPKMSGFGLLREIKKNSTLHDIPVVILSGISDEEVVREGMELGAAGYLNKTCGARQILSTVSQSMFERVKRSFRE